MSNLPPGCQISDIPGNRPEDQKLEALDEALFEIVGECLTDTVYEQLFDFLNTAVEAAYHEGYCEGISDEKMYQEWKNEQDKK